MIWNFPNQALISFPSIINRFNIKLDKGCDITSRFANFLGGKYLVRNLFAISSHVAIDSLGKDLNHILALSLSEKGKIINLTFSAGTPLYCCVSQISKSLQYAHTNHHWEDLQIDNRFAPSESTLSSIRSCPFGLPAS